MTKAILFDLDGVITDTAIYHYKAWKALANKLGGDIDEEFNETLKGVDRVESLKRLLEYNTISLTEDEKLSAMEWKNDYYLELLNDLTPNDILPGISEFFEYLKHEDIKIAIASASKNAPLILEKIGLINEVDTIANPSDVKNGKPAPDIFLLAANNLNIPIEYTVGIEDSQAGLDALTAANIKSIAIGDTLMNATITLNSTKELSGDVLRMIDENN